MTGIQPLQSLQVQCVAQGLCRLLLCTCAPPQALDSICVVPPASTGVHAGQQHVQLRSRVPTFTKWSKHCRPSSTLPLFSQAPSKDVHPTTRSSNGIVCSSCPVSLRGPDRPSRSTMQL